MSNGLRVLVRLASEYAAVDTDSGALAHFQRKRQAGTADSNALADTDRHTDAIPHTLTVARSERVARRISALECFTKPKPNLECRNHIARLDRGAA